MPSNRRLVDALALALSLQAVARDFVQIKHEQYAIKYFPRAITKSCLSAAVTRPSADHRNSTTEAPTNTVIPPSTAACNVDNLQTELSVRKEEVKRQEHIQ